MYCLWISTNACVILNCLLTYMSPPPQCSWTEWPLFSPLGPSDPPSPLLSGGGGPPGECARNTRSTRQQEWYAMLCVLSIQCTVSIVLQGVWLVCGYQSSMNIITMQYSHACSIIMPQCAHVQLARYTVVYLCVCVCRLLNTAQWSMKCK